MIAIVLGAVFGAGLLAAVYGLRPPRPPLVTVLAALGHPAIPAQTRADTAPERGSLLVRGRYRACGRWDFRRQRCAPISRSPNGQWRRSWRLRRPALGSA